MSSSLLPSYGGYRQLKSFRISQLVYDVTVRFCNRYIDRRSRTHDQMVQAARSGVQNIAEGSLASGTSKKFELKLTNVARASLEELRLDYEDFLRQRGMPIWDRHDPRGAHLVARRFITADQVVCWVRDVTRAKKGSEAAPPDYAETAANAAIVLISVACYLLDKQVRQLAEQFEKEGGFTERLYAVRRNRRST
ncbi:MAG: four helix bundle protein [Candidatus Kapabacteria bacterium]|nr:four helix bundle protein [Candidatus Kapabacteria bacterium]